MRKPDIYGPSEPVAWVNAFAINSCMLDAQNERIEALEKQLRVNAFAINSCMQFLTAICNAFACGSRLQYVIVYYINNVKVASFAGLALLAFRNCAFSIYRGCLPSRRSWSP